MSESFVHLHLHSAYSLAEGAIKVKDLVQLCIDENMPAVAMTDTNNMFGALEFALEASSKGVQPIIGCQLAVGEEEHQIVLLVQTEAGYRNLCGLVSDAYLIGEDTRARSSWENIYKRSEGLVCLTGGAKGPINQHLVQSQEKKAKDHLEDLYAAFGDRLYIELQRHGWPEEEQIEDQLIELAYDQKIPLVATNDCYFSDPSVYEAHDALLCIADGRYITEDDRRKVTSQHYFKSAKEMAELFTDIPEAIQNTQIIAQRCSYLLEPIQPILPPFKAERSEQDELRKQAEEGLAWRLENFVLPSLSSRAKGDSPQSRDLDNTERDPSTTLDDKSSRSAQDDIIRQYYDRLEYELGVIKEMGFPGYFLICSDFIGWAKDNDIPVGPGRGSGAGSVVAWSLRITDLDPLKLGLLFERFLNPERLSMPDFDIDFCQSRRDEVISYVQERYGHDSVAQIITFGKLQARAVVRDVGRVLQMPYGLVDRIAKLIPNNPANPTTLGEALAGDEELRKLRESDDTHRKLIDIALQLEGLYRHASTHAAGVVIGDRPLQELIPLYRDPRSEMPVTQFNMKYVEQAGLVKFDFLGLKTMTVIQKSLELIKETQGKDINILQVPLDDEKSYDLISSAQTIGVFQLESAGMRDALRKIKPDKFEDIIALVSLYRPGPMDNIPSYAMRKDGKEDPDYMHPILEPILKDTYGIMIYQEQVLQAAQALAGYTLGAADFLRKAMGKKIKSEMDAQREQFINGAKEHNNVDKGQANEIFDKIAKFAGYGFNRAHASCYALIGYWTAWLKANYPVEFMAASMTLDLGNTDKLAVFKQELDHMKIELRTPDLNHSCPDFKVEENSIRYALAALKGVGEAAMGALVEERSKNGVYQSIEDFASRLDPKAMNKRQFERMTAAGVFDSLNDNRAQVSASGEIILRHAQTLNEERECGQVNLFGGSEDSSLGLPELPETRAWSPLEKLSKEFDAVGFYLSAHPLDTRLEQLERLGIKTHARISVELHNTPAIRCQVAGVMLAKQERVSAKSGNKFAFIKLSDPTGVYEVMLFSDILNATRDILVAGENFLLTVEAESQEEDIRFTVQNIQRLDEALEGKIQEIQIELTDAKPIHKLKQFLDIEGKGRSKISVSLTMPDKRMVSMTIPGTWSLSSQARDQIRVEEGVKAISEK